MLVNLWVLRVKPSHNVHSDLKGTHIASKQKIVLEFTTFQVQDLFKWYTSNLMIISFLTLSLSLSSIKNQ